MEPAAHEAREPFSCRTCWKTVDIVHLARATLDGIRYSCSIHCPCGYTLEGDGRGLRDEVRDLFRETEGMWALRVANLGTNRVAALRALQKITGAAPAALLAVVRDGKPVAEGSLVEIEYVDLQLATTDVDVERVRIDAPPMTR